LPDEESSRGIVFVEKPALVPIVGILSLTDVGNLSLTSKCLSQTLACSLW